MIVNDVSVYFYVDGGYRLYACARSGSLSVDTALIETSVTGSGVWATFKGQKHSVTGSLDGLVNLDEPGMLTLADLRAKQFVFEELLMRWQRTDADGNVYTDELTMIITNSSDNHGIDEANGFSISLQGTGAITQIYTPTPFSPIPPPVTFGLIRVDETAVGGETDITLPETIGKYPLDFVVDGLGYTIIWVGVPTGKEVLFDSITGNFSWSIPMDAGVQYYIIYQ